MFKIKNSLLSNHMGGGMGGGMASACYTYDKPSNQNLLENIDPAPDLSFNREVYMGGSITMDDNVVVNIWGFNDNTNGSMGMNATGPFPSPAIRVTQGQLVNTNLTVNGMLKHTIHHHGIEPDFRSDGVGHTSWDVSGQTHTYQWRPSSAGTYFYHCHTNTVLHAEMGMYGALIIDPPVDPADPAGTKRAFKDGAIYDVEAIWAVDEIDSNWHNQAGSGNMANWTAGLCGEDTGLLQLNDLNPDYFIITGADATANAANRNGAVYTNNNPSANQATSKIPASMLSTETLLIRYINAGFLPQRLRIPAALNATIIASDGHPLPVASQTTISTWETVSAERYDIIIDKPPVGSYAVEFDILDWESGKVLGIAKTKISVL